MNRFSQAPREEILRAAKEIVFEEGLINLNIRGVAQKCGISVGTVYNSFDSKGELLFAVAEDFWNGAHIDYSCLQSNVGLTKKLEQLYADIFAYLHSFKKNLLEQLMMLNAKERNIGKQREGVFFQQVRGGILTLLEQETAIDPNLWNENFTKEKMAEFIFANMLHLLRQEQEEISFFLDVLKKILYTNYSSSTF